jgi:hypothetical protein
MNPLETTDPRVITIREGGRETMMLNRAQRIIMKIGGCVLLFELLFPPWRVEEWGWPFGRAPLFAPPDNNMVNTTLLFLQIAAIVTGTALLVWWCQPHQAIAQSPPEKTSKRGILERLRSLRGPRFFWLLIALFIGLLVFFKAIDSKSPTVANNGLPPGFVLDPTGKQSGGIPPVNPQHAENGVPPGFVPLMRDPPEEATADESDPPEEATADESDPR